MGLDFELFGFNYTSYQIKTEIVLQSFDTIFQLCILIN